MSNQKNKEIICKDPFKIETNNLNFYSKTILVYIIKYLRNPIYKYTSDDWIKFCDFYSFDYFLIESYLYGEYSIDVKEENVKIGEYIIKDSYYYNDERIIDDMYSYISMTEYLKKIKVNDSFDSIQKNINLYNNIYGCFNSINSNIATRECMENEYFDTSFIPQTSTSNIGAISKLLMITQNYTYLEDKDMLENLYDAFNKDIKTYSEMIFLILSLQIIKFSPLISENEETICKNLINTLMSILRNARVIAFFKNYYFFNDKIDWDVRGKNDQTTRIQILYEYNNGDQYSLRLDLPHKGVPYFHLNNLSKGGLEFFPLSLDLYNKAIQVNGEWKDWFIEYGNQMYFLRENKKSEIYNKEHKYLLDMLKEQSHFAVSDYQESNIVYVLELWNNITSNVGKTMPYSTLDPQSYFLLSVAYEFVQDYYYMKRINKKYDYEELKTKFIDYFFDVSLFSLEDKESLKEESISHVLWYAIQLIQERD
nr:hypothetical protein [Clostridioides sp.]